METEMCKTCRKEKTLDEFDIVNGYRRHTCRQCLNARQNNYYRKTYEKVLKSRRAMSQFKNNGKTIEQISIEARENGMTYGKYVAKLYCDKERRLKCQDTTKES